MKVGLAGDEGSGFFELSGDPGVLRGWRSVVGVEARAACGDVAAEIEAVFEGDGGAVEGGAICWIERFTNSSSRSTFFA